MGNFKPQGWSFASMQATKTNILVEKEDSDNNNLIRD